MKKELFVGVIALIFVSVPALSSAQSWTAPGSVPPAGNVSTPINLSSTDQVKSGGISVGSLSVTGGGSFTGSVGIGTTAPIRALQVNGELSLTRSDGTQYINVSDPTGNGGGTIVLRGLTDNGTVQANADVSIIGNLCLGGECKGSWSSVGGVPSGAVMAFDLSACPSGWSNYSQAVGRTVVGAGSAGGLTSRALGSQFGAERQVLSTSQIPAHSHTIFAHTGVESYSTNQSFGYTNKNIGVAGKENAPGYLSVNGAGTQLVGNTGGGQPVDTVQPSVALLYCKKN
jgi:hypothetical protein